MYPQNPQIRHRSRAREVMALAVLLVVGLAGCASPGPNYAPVDAAPFVGMFTGEFVDGKPLYRFPPIEIVGTRGSIGAGT